jgi:hypothetical protein
MQGVAGSQLGPSLGLSKLTATVVLHRSGQIPKTVVLSLHTKKIMGKVSLDPVNARSKTEQTRVLDSSFKPGFTVITVKEV